MSILRGYTVSLFTAIVPFRVYTVKNFPSTIAGKDDLLSTLLSSETTLSVSDAMFMFTTVQWNWKLEARFMLRSIELVNS